jgi:hypothetical protein
VIHCIRRRGRPIAAVRAFDGEAAAAAFRLDVLVVWPQLELAGQSFLHHLEDLAANDDGASARFGI